MTAFYIVLKVGALLAVILLPLTGPRKKKAKSLSGFSKLGVNKNGLNYINDDMVDHRHPVI